ncbi:prolipoprotein diacylglyceryl transferase [candidate division KSB1 bacterium]|nr:prolipoprotein diacylglyceryl transferase [candidate division KSB1 bacterium]
MEDRSRLTLAKIAYAAVFVVALPALLVLWATHTAAIIPLPAWHDHLTGYVLITVGGSLMLGGTIALYHYGKGWPMSPFPPEKFVNAGIYRVLSHPIYIGASLCVVGVALHAGSVSGLWLVSPFFMLACAAWILGVERLALQKRLAPMDFKPLFALPPDAETPTTTWNRISAYVLVFAPCLIAAQIIPLSVNSGTFVPEAWSWLQMITQLKFTTAFYLFIPLFVLFAPLLARTQQRLRNFMLACWIASALVFFMMIIAPPKMTSNAAGSSAFAIAWLWLALPLYAHRFPRLKVLWLAWATIMTSSCVVTRALSLLEVGVGLLLALVALNRVALWRFIQRVAEAIANSWKEWDFGFFRIMNHGLYGGLAAAIGILMAGMLLGKEHLPAILVVAVTSMIVSALWAQWIEGSKKLLRPLGFYGGVLGVIIGAALVHVLLGEDFFLIWAPFAVAAPVIQAIGRVRCLVQGCCHGSITTPEIGIRYFHERSRVVRLAHLKGVPLHATQVYSILTNLFSTIILLKLWFTDMPLPFVIGVCFLLNGLSRFVEEAYRGEPQTLIICGLRLYQWLALLGIILGAFLTTIHYSASHERVQFNSQIFLIAGAGGLLAMFLTGVDFPRSNRRFSRLV